MITGYSNTVSVTTLESPFQFTVDTSQSGVSSSTEFTMPLTTSTGLDMYVDWGDGSAVENITDHTLATHDYGTAGTYTISVTGDILGWQFNNGGDKLKMGDVEKWGVLNISVKAGFYGCTNMTCSATDAPTITSTNLQWFFRECDNFNGAIGNWDISSVEDIQQMFQSATSFNQDISAWNTSSATTMRRMFNGATLFNQNIGAWDTSSVTNMYQMFIAASAFDQDISSWDINQVDDFTGFMQNATGLSTTNYDTTLIGWEASLQAAYPGGAGYPYTISISFGGSQYTLGSAAETARTSLINNFGWTITDGGGV